MVRQQAFTVLQEQPGTTREVYVPAEWQITTNGAVSLSVGAGMVFSNPWHCPPVCSCIVTRKHVTILGANNFAQHTFSLRIEQGQKELHECCFGDTSQQLADALTAAVKTGLNTRSTVSLAQVSFST